MRRSASFAAVISLLILVGCASPSAQTSSTPSLAPGVASTADGTASSEHHVTAPQLTAMQEDNATLTIETDFAEDSAGTELRVEGTSYPLVARYGTQYVFANVRVPKLGDNNAKLVLPSAADTSALLIEFTIHRQMNTIDEYRKYATPFNYKLVNKNPDAHKGEYVKGRAQIYQINEHTLDDGSPYTDGGLDVTNYGYGNWDDNVRFLKKGTTELLQGDVVNYYGVLIGADTYESQAGWNITTPLVRIEFIEK